MQYSFSFLSKFNELYSYLYFLVIKNSEYSIYNDNEMSYSLKSEESKSDSKKGRHHHHKKGF